MTSRCDTEQFPALFFFFFNVSSGGVYLPVGLFTQRVQQCVVTHNTLSSRSFACLFPSQRCFYSVEVLFPKMYSNLIPAVCRKKGSLKYFRQYPLSFFIPPLTFHPVVYFSMPPT